MKKQAHPLNDNKLSNLFWQREKSRFEPKKNYKYKTVRQNWAKYIQEGHLWQEVSVQWFVPAAGSQLPGYTMHLYIGKDQTKMHSALHFYTKMDCSM